MESKTLPQIMNNKGVEIVMNLDLGEMNLTSSLILKQKIKNEVDSNQEILHIRRGERKLSSREGRKENSGEMPMIDFNQGSINKFEAANREKKNEEEVKVLRKELAELTSLLNQIDNYIQSLSKNLIEHEMDLEYVDIHSKQLEKNFETEIDMSSLMSNSKAKNNKMKAKTRSEVFQKKTNYAKELAETMENKNKISAAKAEIYKNYLEERKKFDKIKETLTAKKMRLNGIKKELVEYYHQLLYEGIDYRQEGLVWIIKSIWNLDHKVEISFFPPFLDRKSIDYLFRIAHKNNEIATYKHVLDQEKEKFFRESIKSIKKLKLKDHNNNFFSTSIKEGMLKSNQPENEKYDTSVDVNLKSLSQFFEKKKKTEVDYYKMPLFIRCNAFNKKKTALEAELHLMRKNEMKRLASEFLLNDYKKKYDVNIEIVIGALVGELRNDKEILNYYKYKKVSND